MTFIVGTPVVVLVILVGAIVALSVLLTRSARAERALRERAARFRLVADRAPVDATFPAPMISGFEEYRFPWAMNVAALPMPGGHHD